MQEARRSVLHGLYDLGMTIARGGDGDPRHEIEETIAVDILDHGALAARHRERILLGIRGGRKAVLPLDDRASLGTRRWHDDAGIIPGCGHARTFSFESVFSRALVNRLTISPISSSVTMNGGATITRSPLVPSACPTLGHTVRPASRAASANRSANFAERGNGARLALSSTNSMPASSPRPRTSPTYGRSASGRSRSCNRRPIRAQRSTSLF